MLARPAVSVVASRIFTTFDWFVHPTVPASTYQIQLNPSGPRATAGAVAQRRAGLPVTTPQVVWTSSNAKVIRFAGPAELIAVNVGKTTIKVSAGSATATRDLTVLARKH